MVKPRCKSKSKRQTCSLKYRIRKNVAAHNKKQKKLVKKNRAAGKVRQIRNDPGVPNSAPFKEEVLNEARERREQEELDRLRQREEQRRQAMNKKTLASIQADAERRQKEFEAKESMIGNIASSSSMGLLKNENSRTYYKDFHKVVETSDVIIEVLDARDPLGCRSREVEKVIMEQNPNKKIILLLNKIDLVPKQNVEEWLKYLRNEFPTVAFKSSTQTQKDRLTQCKVPVKHLTAQILSNTSQCVGADSLLKLLANYCRRDDIETSIVVGVVGYPNVGKSSVINSLKRARACGVGSTPGFTKSVKEVVISKNIKILDSPGIVMASGSNEAAVVLRNCVKVETLEDLVAPVDAIISRCQKNQLMMKYNIGNFDDVNDFLALIAKRFGKLKKGGRPNINAAAKGILNDWNSGKISYFTHPPLVKNVHVGAKVVKDFGKEFDWSSLESDNQRALKEVKGAPSASHSIELTAAVMCNDEVMESNEDVESGGVKVEMPSTSAADDQMEMDDDQQLGQIEVNLNGKRTKKVPAQKPSKMAKFDRENPFSGVVKSGSNIQANKQMRNVMKAKKKERKRADNISDGLTGLMEAATVGLGSSSRRNDDSDVDME